MADAAFPPGARNLPGAFVQLIPDIVLFTPNIVLFQYNPAKITRGLTPWNPFDTTTSAQGGAAPDVSPNPPDEKISFDLFLDAADPAQVDNPINIATGVASRIAAIKKLAKPSQGLIGDLVKSAASLVGKGGEIAHRPTVPITFLIFGPGLMLPVRLTSLSIEETMFTGLLYPIHAKVTVQLQVLTPNLFRCREGFLSDLAIACWNLNELQEDLLAVANLVNTGFDIAGLVQG
ncbi:MAG: hypothetical protein JOZ90_04180 [Alphaproteobacteria bacterium]|nr:hypothetical protein [Alphaproteobacteria bacterium]MBV9373190.1 hypothetical protein [Alphaproteobacteria bacterium]MBV9900279.1 hypothetical protein [Alphaproteobacteria bacterium]